MHDGYLFTLGVCGSASASGPAPALLDAMLAALPPVKRAAFLGEISPLDDNYHLYDPMRDPILHDLRDAEVVLFVTPLSAAGWPARVTALVEQIAQMAAAGALRDKIAVLVAVGAAADIHATALLTDLAQAWAAAGVTIAATLPLTTDEGSDPSSVERVQAAARQAYAQARQRVPDALP